MAHEIDTTTGKPAMAYVGAVPWHGLGSPLTPGADLITWQKEAGMDWTLNASPVLFAGEEDDEGKLPINVFGERQVLWRSDTHAPLSVVGAEYRVVHPPQVIEFFRDLIADHGFALETAGCLFGGRKFWGLAKVGEGFKLGGEDEIKPYLLMATSCDGSMATAVHLTSVRVVCNNTLRMSIGANGANAHIRVPHNAMFDAAAAKGQLGIVGDAFDAFIETAETLAALKLGRDQAIQLVADELKDEWFTATGEAMSQEQMMTSSVILRRIIALYDGEGIGARMVSAHGTGWGLVNAVTQYWDHEAGAKGDRSRAFERAHLTDRAKFKVTFANRVLAVA